MTGYVAFVDAVRVGLFWVALAVAAIAALDWAVRTRRVSPFSPLARFCRRFVDPLMAPVERRIVRRGGLPSSAPWWTLVVVIVGGIVLIALLRFVGGLMVDVAFGVSSPGRLGGLLLRWGFGVLRLALIVRVIASWIQISPYSVWIRWAFVLTEWMLAPLRRVIPPFSMVDVTPLIAYFALSIIESMLV